MRNQDRHNSPQGQAQSRPRTLADSALDLRANPFKGELPSDENIRRVRDLAERHRDMLVPITQDTIVKISGFELLQRAKDFTLESGVMYVRGYDARSTTGTILRDPDTNATVTLREEWRPPSLKDSLIYYEGWFAVPLTTPVVATTYCANGSALVVALGSDEAKNVAVKALIVLGPNGERPFYEYIKTGTNDRLLRVGGNPEPAAELPVTKSLSFSRYDRIQKLADSLGGRDGIIGKIIFKATEAHRLRALHAAATQEFEIALPRLEVEMHKAMPDRKVIEPALREMAIRRGLMGG